MVYLKLLNPLRKTRTMYPAPTTYRISILRRVARYLNLDHSSSETKEELISQYACKPPTLPLTSPTCTRSLHALAWEPTTVEIKTLEVPLHLREPQMPALDCPTYDRARQYSPTNLRRNPHTVFVKNANSPTNSPRTYLPVTSASRVTRLTPSPATALAATLRLWFFTGNRLTDEQGIELHGDVWLTFPQFLLRNFYRY